MQTVAISLTFTKRTLLGQVFAGVSFSVGLVTNIAGLYKIAESKPAGHFN
jgi:hypothetical protein